jgi:aldose 1-epimerase
MGNDVITLGHDELLVSVWTTGAALNSVQAPDRDGRLAEVVPGYSSLIDRQRGIAFLGEIVGPFANRIARARFPLDGRDVELAANEGANILHGGPNAFYRQTWELLDQAPDAVRLGLTWPDGANGFPGPIRAEVTYRVDGPTLVHEVTATADQPTPVSIVSHVYFNLSGRLTPVHDHELAIAAGRYLPVDDDLIPLPSAPADVAGSFDFRTPRRLDQVLSSDHPQIRRCGGLDHAFVLDHAPDAGVVPVAHLTHPPSGRRVTIQTDFPALQVFTGQTLDDDHIAHPPGPPVPYCAVAIETEEFPDAPNRLDFPGVILRPGETYQRTTRWTFGVVDEDQ